MELRLFSFLLLPLIIIGSEGLGNGTDHQKDILLSRTKRHFFRARYPLDRGVHYAWQNPIRTAPTVPTRSFTTEPPITEAITTVTYWWQERDRYPTEPNARPTYPTRFPTTEDNGGNRWTENKPGNVDPSDGQETYPTRNPQTPRYPTGNHPPPRYPTRTTPPPRYPTENPPPPRYPTRSTPPPRYPTGNPPTPRYPTTENTNSETYYDRGTGSDRERNPPGYNPNSNPNDRDRATERYPSRESNFNQRNPNRESDLERRNPNREPGFDRRNPNRESVSDRRNPNREPGYAGRNPSTAVDTNQNGNNRNQNGNRRTQTQNQKCQSGSRLSRTDGRCHILGSRGPCNENMAFYSDPNNLNSEYGSCDCFQNFNRPIVYHPDTDKCYFIYQRAFCQPDEWLILDPELGNQPTCSVNRCQTWARTVAPSWDWRRNGPELDMQGLVAILNEQRCVELQWECIRESRDENERISELLSPQKAPDGKRKDVVLRFDGPNLVCDRETSVEFPIYRPDANTLKDKDTEMGCKKGLFNKWRSEHNCTFT